MVNYRDCPSQSKKTNPYLKKKNLLKIKKKKNSKRNKNEIKWFSLLGSHLKFLKKNVLLTRFKQRNLSQESVFFSWLRCLSLYFLSLLILQTWWKFQECGSNFKNSSNKSPKKDMDLAMITTTTIIQAPLRDIASSWPLQ